MKILVNGEDKTVDDGLSVTALLAALEVKMPDMVTVEINDSIQKREEFDSTIVQEGDKIEFLYFMGGGR
jgi:sulfur carrier protein